MFKKNTFILGFLLTVSLLVFSPFMSFAATGDIVDTASMSDKTGLANVDITRILTNVLNWMLGVIGIIALIGFVISGGQYILSGGDEKMMEKGKHNMQYSIMGIVVVLGSFVIIKAIDAILKGSVMW
ncbi:MAG TPA: hypothetical protein DIC35_03715 [Candidatus Moranbacteria bacterium]|nr:hypothetical protein [Candidatus Moranbacteria bacterium]